ncbi:hypothetical protein [Aureimonas altamirensis]|uniref:hypothetical protein n=1 Tax=Aureimonas altamirensis TaxID=370622 RepID=UPI00068A1281|nr:hypothetical protein [Aureimonas altamirensis]
MTDHSQLVKVLDWKQERWSRELFRAHSAVGTYRITEYAGMRQPFKLEGVMAGIHYETLDAAKAAAQADYTARILSALNLDTIDALQARVEALDAELYRAKVVATDRSYMMDAYRAMLGPKGLEVAVMWEKQGVTRQHTSWGPDAWKLSGEDRAGVLLDIEALPKIPSEID